MLRPAPGYETGTLPRLVFFRVPLAFAVLLCWLLPAFAEQGPPSVAPIAERLIAAVVNISSTQVAKGPQGVPLPNVPKGSPFEEFFEEFFNKRGGQNAPGGRRVSSLGSGFVIDGKEGLIVTNNHVIESADEISVNFHDGSKLKVDKVLGRDTKTDLALLKVTPKKPLAAVTFGSSAAMKVGDWVMAIGNPFGLGGSVTVGIISATRRDINAGPYDDFLQTDAAINKGNSGGPLFNMNGEVIGVNTAIISPTGGSIGIGFSVPSDLAQIVIGQLKEYGETRRGWLGVKIQSVTDEIAETLNLPEAEGALVSFVTSGSPAAAAGLEPGDLIMKFDGQQVTQMRGLPRLVAQTPIGKTVEIEILRKGERKKIQAVIGRLTEEEDKDDKNGGTPSQPGAAPPKENGGLMGLKLKPLDDALRKTYGLAAGLNGVVVIEADPQSAAAERGLRAGDVIVEAAQQRVATPADIAAAIERVRKAGKTSILFGVASGKGELRFVAVPLN